MNPQKPLISIVVPVFNAEKFLHQTIATVRDQSYKNWELILIDDASTDASAKIIDSYLASEKRMRLIPMSSNKGVAGARNKGIEAARGTYLAFLDADDLWLNTKLEKQLSFMMTRKSNFSYTSYEFADSIGSPTGNIVTVPTEVTMLDYLKNNIIWTSTVMIDMSKIRKADIYMPKLSYGEDASAWINILNIYGSAHGMRESLSLYRRTSSSATANKLKVLGKKWRLYMNMENIPKSYKVRYYVISIANAMKKRI